MADKIETNKQIIIDTSPAGGRSGISLNTVNGYGGSVTDMLHARDAESTSETHTRTLIPAVTEHVVMNIPDFSKLR